MTSQRAIIPEITELKTELDRATAYEDSTATEIEKISERSTVADSEALKLARNLAPIGSVTEACERRIFLRLDLDKARGAAAVAKQTRERIDHKYQHACALKDRAELSATAAKFYEKFPSAYQSHAERIVGAVASNRLAVDKVERLSSRSRGPRLRFRDSLFADRFTQYLRLPAHLGAADPPWYWRVLRNDFTHFEDLKQLPSEILVPLDLLRFDAPVDSPEDWDLTSKKIKESEAHLFGLYLEPAKALLRVLYEEWELRRSILDANKRFAAFRVEAIEIAKLTPQGRIPSVDRFFVEVSLPIPNSREFLWAGGDPSGLGKMPW